jgi:hypothetical protein
LFGFYILSIGLALRLTKVSAEVFEWHIPKTPATAIVLPKDEPDAHSTGNRKLAEGDVREGGNAEGGKAVS